MMAAQMLGQHRVPQGQPPLKLPTQPGIGSAALLPAQESAADEDAHRDADDNQRGDDGDAACDQGQRQAERESGGCRQAGAEPQLIGCQSTHDHGLAVEAVRKKRHQPVAQVLRRSDHAAPPLQHAGCTGKQPDADHEQDGTHGDGQAELPPRCTPVVDLRVARIGVVADADEHR